MADFYRMINCNSQNHLRVHPIQALQYPNKNILINPKSMLSYLSQTSRMVQVHTRTSQYDYSFQTFRRLCTYPYDFKILISKELSSYRTSTKASTSYSHTICPAPATQAQHQSINPRPSRPNYQNIFSVNYPDLLARRR